MTNVIVVNLTPHAIRVLGDDNQLIAEFPPSGAVARADSHERPENMVDGIPVVSQEFGAVHNVPAPEPGTIYLVSMVVGQAMARTRNDIYGPNTSPGSAVRNEAGHIIGVKGFVKY
jgi:hypothetical protein